jgi:hypothetical protein
MRFSLIRWLFVQRVNGSLSIVRCPFVCEETNGSNPFANGLNGPAYLCSCYFIVRSYAPRPPPLFSSRFLRVAAVLLLLSYLPGPSLIPCGT